MIAVMWLTTCLDQVLVTTQQLALKTGTREPRFADNGSLTTFDSYTYCLQSSQQLLLQSCFHLAVLAIASGFA
jgi:hypothetical protein